jgi:hypothetical protein
LYTDNHNLQCKLHSNSTTNNIAGLPRQYNGCVLSNTISRGCSILCVVSYGRFKWRV